MLQHYNCMPNQGIKSSKTIDPQIHTSSTGSELQTLISLPRSHPIYDPNTQIAAVVLISSEDSASAAHVSHGNFLPTAFAVKGW